VKLVVGFVRHARRWDTTELPAAFARGIGVAFDQKAARVLEAELRREEDD
jgi:hypothetical protein